MFDFDNNLTAILGPTNTGKTFKAFEKLFTYSSGIFGFPLRLLARENYDKAVKKIGLSRVALITGEEKILPREAKYFFCTVESMPVNITVDCIIIDEVQLAADYERGHIFTDRILNFRGAFETIFLGSLTIKNILIDLFPKIKIEQNERFSNLSFLPKQGLSKLKPRSAVIAFNINKVYEIAETVRTYKGGAAVVLGSLSPRTRNAQVEIYEDKKVDYLVATDAIGMGLNLNINHVTFSSLEKFDGRYNRNLHPNEIGQIAGRAGRYKTDGTFGWTKNITQFDQTLVKSVESHNYDQIHKIYWRNSKINFSTVQDVLGSLKKFPIKKYFIHKKNASDEINFRTLIEDNDIKPYLKDPYSIKKLWNICQIPDFEKVFNDNYLYFLKNFFIILSKNNNKIPEDWINTNINKLQDITGGISELSIKISQIRRWTYISNHYEWLDKPVYWQEKTLQIENELSDKLHNSLTNKFVDFNSIYFNNYNKDQNFDKISINDKNEIILDNQNYGHVYGFDIKLNKNSFSNSLFLISRVKKSLRIMIDKKINNFLNAPDDSINLGDISKIKLNNEVKLYWGEEEVGFLHKGNKIYTPIAEAINSEFLSSEQKLLVSAKLQNWINNKINVDLFPISEKIQNDLSSSLRAIVFNCYENLGTLPIDDFKDHISKFTQQDKIDLSKLGIRIGAKFFFSPNLMKKKPIELSAILWKIFNKTKDENLLPLPKDGRVSFVTKTQLPYNYWQCIGYILINTFAFRIDVFERIFYLARKKIKYGPFLESSEFMSPLGCNSSQLSDIFKFCGYEPINLLNEKKLYFFKQVKKLTKKNNRIKNKKNKIIKNKTSIDPDSPFAVLEKLL
tara:strand:+ start:2896 stop:5436 length:2541 start_codon:yes stop_codon:yes gene_type:complete